MMKDSRQNKWRKQAPDIFWACMVTIIVGAFALGKTVGEHGLTFAYIEKKLTSPLWQDAFAEENTRARKRKWIKQRHFGKER